MKNPLFHAFIDAAQQCGYPYTEDMNGFQQEGVGPMDMTTYKGKRWSAAQAYLRPALSRKNLKIQSKAMVTKVVFEGTKALGVEYVTSKLWNSLKQGHITWTQKSMTKITKDHKNLNKFTTE